MLLSSTISFFSSVATPPPLPFSGMCQAMVNQDQKGLLKACRHLNIEVLFHAHQAQQNHQDCFVSPLQATQPSPQTQSQEHAYLMPLIFFHRPMDGSGRLGSRMSKEDRLSSTTQTSAKCAVIYVRFGCLCFASAC